MGKFFKKNYLIIIFVVIQSVFYVITGLNKAYIHIDEAYSFGLTHYDKIELEHNEDFFDNWHEKEYYKDYLTVGEDEKSDFRPVYENQKNDVHPPIYYIFLRLAMNIAGENFSIWTGIILNIIIYGFITIFMYLILRKLFKDERHEETKAMALSFISSVTLASLSNAVYIRMYSLLTLEILITVFMHIKLLEKFDAKNLTLIRSSRTYRSTYSLLLFVLRRIFVFSYSSKIFKEKENKRTFNIYRSPCLSRSFITRHIPIFYKSYVFWIQGTRCN